MEVDEQEVVSTFGIDIHNFVNEVEGLRATFPLVSDTLDESAIAANSRLSSFVLDNGFAVRDENSPNTLNLLGPLPPEQWREYWHLFLDDQRRRSALVLVQRAMFTSLVSQFDAYVGRLIRCILRLQPFLLAEGDDADEKRRNTIPYEKLVQFSSIGDAQEYVLEKVVGSILRKSHTKQFEWMEKQAGIPLTKDLKCWPLFVELTQRRHLFVHCNGFVTAEYLETCRRHQASIDVTLKAGDFLGLDSDYFRATSACVLEIGFKLGHVLWRKLVPGERQDAEANFTEHCFQLIHHEDYELAIELLRFAHDTRPMNFSSEETRLSNRLNLAQAYKWLEREDDCRRELQQEDWASKRDKYRLASHVLCDEFDAAIEIMKKMGNHSQEFKAADYRGWPIFRELRKSDLFRQAFEDIFAEPLELVRDTLEAHEESTDMRQTDDKCVTSK